MHPNRISDSISSSVEEDLADEIRYCNTIAPDSLQNRQQVISYHLAVKAATLSTRRETHFNHILNPKLHVL